MADSDRSFFTELNWFDEEQCNRLDDELRWARAECPVSTRTTTAACTS